MLGFHAVSEQPVSALAGAAVPVCDTARGRPAQDGPAAAGRLSEAGSSAGRADESQTARERTPGTGDTTWGHADENRTVDDLRPDPGAPYQPLLPAVTPADAALVVDESRASSREHPSEAAATAARLSESDSNNVRAAEVDAGRPSRPPACADER